jgi:hypothetical protein
MSHPSPLLVRAPKVKQELTAFGLERFHSEFEAAARQIYPSYPDISDDEKAAISDWFVLEYVLPDHRTVLSHFLEARKDISDVVIAEQWGTVVQGIFQVKQIVQDNLFQLNNLVNDVTYSVASLAPEALGLEKGEYLAARILPLEDIHFFTGVIDRLPTRKKDEIYQLVSEIQLQNPRMAFIDNMERLDLAYRIQQEEHHDFVAFFGSDECILTGHELEEKLREFYHYRYFQKKDHATGNTMAKVFQDRYHQQPLPPIFDFLPDLAATDDVGIIYDLTEGMLFLRRYGTFREIFSNPAFEEIPDYREVILGYLEDPNISSLPFRRMISAYPEQSVEVFKAVLKRKRFNLDKDVPKLMAKYKPMEALTRLTPGAIPALVRSKTFLKSLKAGHKW